MWELIADSTEQDALQQVFAGTKETSATSTRPDLAQGP